MTTQDVHRAYKYRFYPTAQQEDNLLRTWGCVRLVYNKALEMRTSAWYERQQRISYAETDKALTGWKKTEELAFLNDVSAVALQQARTATSLTQPSVGVRQLLGEEGEISALQVEAEVDPWHQIHQVSAVDT